MSSLDPSHHHGGFHPHVDHLANQPISKLAPFTAIIITVILVVIFLVRYYIFEGWLMNKCYGDIYKRLSEINRRGFVNHHMAAVLKIIMILGAAYPFIAVAFAKAGVHTPYLGSPIVTLGDMLIVMNELFICMYIFELFYRAKLSPVAVMHHIGAVVIAQAAVAMTINWRTEKDSTIEFILCFVWGAFDVVAEFWPHLAIILYRCYPDDHVFLMKIFKFAGWSTFMGTIIETITVMWLFGTLWDRWTIDFKVLTPMLHLVFSAAQLWGAWNFRSMYLRQKKLAMEQEEAELGLGAGISMQDSHEEKKLKQASGPTLTTRIRGLFTRSRAV